jgi:hypothetical protein
MRGWRSSAVTIATCLATTLGAQSASCASQPVTVRDVCQKGVDLFAVFAPQLGGALAAGGPVLGTARTGDGLSLTLRLNGVAALVPDLSAQPFSVGGPQVSTIATTRTPVLLPAVDAAFSLSPGIRAGRQRVLAVDLLASIVYLRTSDVGAVNVGPGKGTFSSSPFRVGYGVRVGVLSESRRVPAVSVSYLRRSLPRASLVTSAPILGPGASSLRDTIALTESSLRADAFRLAISKSVGRVEVGGGIGEDRFRNFAQLQAMITPSVFGAPLPPQRMTAVLTRSNRRQSAYGSLAVRVGHYHVGAEAGAVFGGDEFPTFNSISGYERGATRGHASLGVRYRF